MGMRPVSDVTAYAIERATGRNCLYVGVSNLCGGLSVGAAGVRASSRAWHGVDCDAALSKNHPELSLTICDLNLSFHIEAPGVELIVMTEVMEHLWSPVRTLRQLGKDFPGRSFLGSVPNGMSAGRILMAILAPFRYGREDSFHTMLFNPLTLRNTLAAAELRNVTLTPYVNRVWLRPIVHLRPELASGYIIEATFPSVPPTDPRP